MMQAEAAQKNALHELGFKIFLDRYAQKDMTRASLAVGDLVIVVVDAKTGQREIGRVSALELPTVTIELLDGATVTRDVENVDKPVETDPGQMMDRVAAGVAAVEKSARLRKQWAANFRWLLEDWKFVPAGRILTAAGTEQKLTYYNCMPPEQEILTAEGYKPLGAVKVGDLVVTHRNRVRPVLHRFERDADEPLYIIRSRKIGYDDLRLTGEHKVYAIRSAWVNKHKSRDGLRLAQQPDWIAAQDLKVGDFVAAAYHDEECPPDPIYLSDYLPGYSAEAGKLFKPTTRGERGQVQDWGTHYALNERLELDGDLCYLFGRWLGDGCVTHRTGTDIPSGIKIVFGLDEKAEAERIAQIIAAKFGLEAALKLSSTGRWYDLWANSLPLGQFFKVFLGAYSYGKRIPDALMHLPHDLTLDLLHGVFSADGYISDNKLGILLANRALAVQLHQLLLRLGYLFSIRENTHRLGRVPAYRLQATANECGPLFERFFGADAPDHTIDQRYYIEHDGLKWVRITDIAVEHYTGPVIDLEVAEDHSFVSAGVVVSNCYVVPSPRDSRGGIIETLLQMTEIMSRGGGVGINVSSLRPRQAYVKGVNGRSSGAVSWGALYSFVTGLIEQGGSRRGALMLILNDWHPDVFDFINSKRTAGQITNANISVGVSDTLMEAVKADGDWDLVFPDTSYDDYDDVWDGDLEAWRAAGRRVITYRTVKARAVWDAIIESAWASAEPGVFFRDRYNKMSNSAYYAPIIATNPCVTGDTLVATEAGYTPARDLKVGMFIRTPAGLKPIEKVYNNGVQHIYRVEFSDGGHLECTADHKLKVVRDKKYEWVAVSELRQGDKVLVAANEAFGAARDLPEEAVRYIQKRGLNVSARYDRTLGFLAGAVLGDGTLRQLPNRNSYQNVCKVAFGAAESEWLESFRHTLDAIGIHSHITHAKKNIPQPGGAALVHQSIALDCYKLSTLLIRIGMQPNVRAAHKAVPQAFMTLDREFLAGLLDGLFSTDGSVNMKRDNPMLRFSTASYELAQQVRLLLLQFGIHGRIYTVKRDEALTYDGRSMYGTGVKYDVVVMNEGVQRFYSEIGLSHPQKAARLKDVAENWHCIGGTWTAAVVSIQDTERDEEVFDVYEPNTLTWVTNGYVSFDCGEQGLPAWGVCNLGAINLARFYDADKHDVDWEMLDKTARYATRFLDNIIDTTPYFFAENEAQQLSERRVGLNNMGLAELLIRLGIRYGSDESVAFIDRLYAFLMRAIYETSIELAQEKGPFPQFVADKFVQSGFMQSMPADIREQVRQHGIRNVTLTTQAPNGTIGTMVNTSTGIEPFFSWVYYRKSRLGLHEEQVPLVKEWREAHPGAAELPDYFVTAMDLTPDEHVRVQGAIQRWVDSSISKTANVPNEYTVEQVSDLYWYMYELGCKGGTIYRDGSRSEQVLMLKEDDKPGAGASENGSGKVEQVTTPHKVYPRPRQLSGVTVSRKTPFGTAYITMNSDENNCPFEVFVTVGKAGSDLQADAEGLGRMVSLQLRTTAPQNRMEMLKLIIDQLLGIGGARSMGLGAQRVTSLPDVVAGALLEHYFPPASDRQLKLPINGDAEQPAPASAPEQPHGGIYSGADLCPECGTVSLIRAEGCRKCLTCGYSEC